VFAPVHGQTIRLAGFSQFVFASAFEKGILSLVSAMSNKGFFNTPPIMGHKESFLPPIANGTHAKQILTGPSILVAAAMYQILKKQMTGTHISKLYQHVWKFISKSEARDKVGRVMQYGCRALQGLLGHMGPNFWLQPYKSVIAEVQTTLAWARRTHRWGKEMPHIPKLGEAISEGDILQATQSTILITFLVQDHIYWLLKVGILKFEQYSAIQWHRRNLRFITVSHVFNFALCYRDICRIRDKQAKGTADEEKAEKEIKDNKMMMVRYVLTFIQMLHVSGVKAMDDTYIGVFGMISSAIDASKQW
jgi:hypothetical protein